MNPLDKYPAVRSALYLVQWIVTGVQTVLSAYFAFAEGDVAGWPRWFLATLAVTPVLWAYLGVTAQANTDASPDTYVPDEGPEGDEVSGNQGLLFGEDDLGHP